MKCRSAAVKNEPRSVVGWIKKSSAGLHLREDARNGGLDLK